MYEDEINLTQAEFYMSECFELAKCGLGRTSPNPAVGAIVLDKNGVPRGKGFHKKAGLEHAEVAAIKEAGIKANGGTLIVSLEPCCHFGKTPPCTDLIIESQIKEVIFCNYDINPLINKKGEQVLLDNKIKVISRVLESQGLELNKFFFKWIKTKLPWITLKQAQTLDGKIGLKESKNVKITSEHSNIEVHKLRNTYDAILVGANTVITDNPELTVRNLNTETDVRNPVKVILDPKLITDPDAKVYKNNSKVYLATVKGHAKEKLNKFLKNNIPQNEYIKILEFDKIKDNHIDLKNLFLELGKMDILSVLVEAGPILAGELLSFGLIDEYILFFSPLIFGESGVNSIHFNSLANPQNMPELEVFNYRAIGNDLMISLRNKKDH